MKRHRFAIWGITALCFAMLFAAPAVQAYSGLYGNACSGAGGSAVCASSGQKTDPLTGPNGVITDVVQIVVLVGSIAAVIMILIGAMMYVISDDDSGKISTAKNIIVYALVGVVVMAAGQGFVLFVLNKL